MKRACLILTFVFTTSILIATAGISHSQAVLQAPGRLYLSIPLQDEAVIARTAVVVQRHIAQARADIHNKSLKNAGYEVTEAAILMRTMRENLSSSMAKNLITIARKHLEYTPAKRVLRDLSPIYVALDKIEDYIPTDKARRHIDQAGKYLEKGDKEGADKELALADRRLVSIAVEYPLIKAEKYVIEAKKYLAERKPGKADAALVVAEQKTQAIYPGLENPIHQADSSLWQATKSYSAGKIAEAKTYIAQAKVYLERASKTGNAKGKAEVAKLSGEMDALEMKIDRGEKESESALKSVWERGKALAERAAEYLAAGYEREETTLTDENDLIEAKLHVSYAETYQVTTGEPEKAVKEIDEALSYLKKGMHNKLVDRSTILKISKEEKELNVLKANSEKNGADVEERYESIKSALSRLIQEI